MKTPVEQLRESIMEDTLTGVASVTTDGTTITAFSPRQRLEALRDAERREQSANTTLPLRFTPIRSKGL